MEPIYIPGDATTNFWMYASLLVMVSFIGFLLYAIYKIWHEQPPSVLYHIQMTQKPGCERTSTQDCETLTQRNRIGYE
ncbi:hypothetical protein CRM22_009983 [Opisthorchis felineus]|uniref:Uncharacterized protein n=1 Tax=Opisthorchis felineus TaxID=147828 RepID=A0A4S2L3J7_OPIFE|nr:hypothetical protein CRM22_009983 [Opisthorchis felineus]